MSKTKATEVGRKTDDNAQQENVDVIAAYLAKEEAATKNRRKVTSGRNIPYADIKELVDALVKGLPGGAKAIDVSQAKLMVIDVLTVKYKAMPEGHDRTFVKVGMERVEMTLSEAKALRLSQLEFSVKEGNVYRMIRQIKEHMLPKSS
jgi:hypothetical protein